MKDLKDRTVRGGLVTVSALALKFVLRKGSLVVLARFLTPNDFGLVGMVTAETEVRSIFKDAGLSRVTVQRLTISNEQIPTLFWLNMSAGAVLFYLCLAIAPVLVVFYHEPHLFWVTATLASGFVFGAGAAQHGALLQRQMRFFCTGSGRHPLPIRKCRHCDHNGCEGLRILDSSGYECCSSGGLCNLGVAHL